MDEYLELQRYGRDKTTLIDNGYILSGAFRKKFDAISTNIDVSRTLYSKAKEMLMHRSRTKYEDMYWIDGDCGKVLAKETNAIEEEQILYSNSVQCAISGRENVIAMHTHPCSMPPSIADFNSVYEHNYMLGIVVCHNGKVFCYKSSETVTQTMYNLYVADYYQLLHDEYEAQIAALNEMMKTYDIAYWEVE